MASCCGPRGCDEVFNVAFARRLAKRYRRKGLDRTAGRMVEALTDRGVDGAMVLEIGGGIGAIQIELLKRGAARTVNVELSSAYEADAAELLRAAGLTERVDRRVVDIALTPDVVDSADVVVLHRVMCCYPDYRLLLAAAADHARRVLVFSYPPDNLIARFFTRHGEPDSADPTTAVPYVRTRPITDARRPRRPRAPRLGAAPRSVGCRARRKGHRITHPEQDPAGRCCPYCTPQRPTPQGRDASMTTANRTSHLYACLRVLRPLRRSSSGSAGRVRRPLARMKAADPRLD